MDAIESPACNTFPQCRAMRATPNRTAPQTTVTYLDLRSQTASALPDFAPPASGGSIRDATGRHKSTTVVDASEFSAALKFDIAAARIAAITSPATPEGRFSQTYNG